MKLVAVTGVEGSLSRPAAFARVYGVGRDRVPKRGIPELGEFVNAGGSGLLWNLRITVFFQQACCA